MKGVDAGKRLSFRVQNLNKSCKCDFLSTQFSANCTEFNTKEERVLFCGGCGFAQLGMTRGDKRDKL